MTDREMIAEVKEELEVRFMPTRLKIDKLASIQSLLTLTKPVLNGFTDEQKWESVWEEHEMTAIKEKILIIQPHPLIGGGFLLYFLNMKKIIFIVMMLLGLGVNAQTMEKDYVNYLLDKEQVQNKRTELFTNTKRVIVRRNRLVFVFDRKMFKEMGLRGRVKVGSR
jgi:hypothetical protein